MKEIVSELADGWGEIKRSSRKIEFGTLILDPMATIGKHGHYDEKKGYKHCEIYITFSFKIRVNKRWRFISICHNSEHEAYNISRRYSAKIIFIKLWW